VPAQERPHRQILGRPEVIDGRTSNLPDLVSKSDAIEQLDLLAVDQGVS